MTFTTNIRFLALKDREIKGDDGHVTKGFNFEFFDDTQTTQRVWVTQNDANLDLIVALKSCGFGDELSATFNLTQSNNRLRLQLAAIE